MRLPQVQIESVRAQLGIQQRPTTLEIRQPQGEITIRQPQAEVAYEIKKGTLHIDQTEAFADANLMHINRRMREWTEKGKQNVLKAIAEKIREGERLMKIENSGNTIPQIEKNSGSEYKSFTLGYIPSSTSKVKFQYERGEVNVNIKQNTPEIQTKMHEPIIDVKKGDISIYLRQKPSINFTVSGLNINKIG